VGGAVLLLAAPRAGAVPDRPLHDPAEGGADGLGGRGACARRRSVRLRQPSTRRVECAAPRRLASGSPPGLGCSGAERVGDPDARPTGPVSPRGLGGATSTGDHVPGIRCTGRAGRGDRPGAAGVGSAPAASSAPVLAPRSRRTPRAALLGRSEVHRARGRRREDQRRPTLIPRAHRGPEPAIGTRPGSGGRERIRHRCILHDHPLGQRRPSRQAHEDANEDRTSRCGMLRPCVRT
jgi:hypothetical protein